MPDDGAKTERLAPGRGFRPALARATALAYRYRVYLLFAVIFAVMSNIAPKFLTPGNIGNIFKATSINLPAAVGFTIVLICGQLDLSIGSAMTMGGMLVIGLQPRFAELLPQHPELTWAMSITAALLSGLVLGLANGLLVAKAKISSFIVTLGTMIVVQNAVFIYSKGGTIPASTFALSDWFQDPAFWVITPQILLPFLVMVAMVVFLRWTPTGKSFYLLGGNPQTAWYSGLHIDRYVVGAFVFSGVLSAMGGAIITMSEAGANPTLGDGSLMTIVAAVIIGGTSMKGGKGSIVGSMVALMALAALINGLSCRGAGFHVQLMASGLVLASIILYDAYSLHRREKKRGQRQDLLAELRQRGAT